MVKCRSQKCLERQRKIVNKIMLTIHPDSRYDYEEVKKRCRPFIQFGEWKTWVYLNKEE